MTRAVRDCLVDGYASLITGLELPDPRDRHVLPTAIRCGAQVIVTSNLKHFPPETLAAYEIEAQHPDDFVLNLIDLSPVAIANVIREPSAALKNPPRSIPDVLAALESAGLIQTTARLRELLGRG